ncbi:MAG: type II toxin-antitoxin system VapC family toxin [Chloroflexi bacterium]|nr:type II toxin-antitoxin system VapC family toxin [Chloroflexota bacterium]
MKWIIAEEQSDFAARLTGSEYELVVPDLFHLELANVIWKQFRRGEVDAAAARELLDLIKGLPVERTNTNELLPPALDIAMQHRRTVYDSVHVALALREQCQFVTADLRLFNALSAAYPGTMLWVEAIAEPPLQ